MPLPGIMEHEVTGIVMTVNRRVYASVIDCFLALWQVLVGV